jgi:coenzyme Q-binding protein COQ10
VIIRTTGRELPFSGDQMFDLAADIERYPEFLHGWIEARIVRRDPGGCEVDQVLGIGPVRHRFRSQAVFQRPQRILVQSSAEPFRHFSLEWLINADPAGGCRVGVAADVQMRSWLLQRVVDRTLPAAVNDILTAFQARAHIVYPGGGRIQPT